MPYRFICTICACLAAVAVLGWFASMRMIQAAPSQPDAIHNIPRNEHGKIVYLTSFEAAWGPLCGGVGACAIVTGAVLARYAKGSPKSKFFV